MVLNREYPVAFIMLYQLDWKKIINPLTCQGNLFAFYVYATVSV